MDLNFIPYNIFGFPYRASSLDAIFISEKFAAERFFSAVERPDAEHLDELAGDLSDFYGVTDKKSALERIYAFDDLAHFSALLALFRRAAERLGEMSFEEFGANFLSDEDVKSKFNAFGIKFDEKSFAQHKEDFVMLAKDCFEDGTTQKFLKFCEATKDLYAFCERRGIRAFDYAVIFQIAANSFAVGYIAQSDFEEIINRYGERVEREFGGWSEFIASYILGGVFMSFDEDTIKSDIKFRATPIYTCLSSPYDMFKASGIWVQSVDEARAELKPVLEKYVDMSEIAAQKEESSLILKDYEAECEKSGLRMEDFSKAIDIFYEDFYGFFKNRRCEELVRISEQTFVITPVTTLEMQYSVLEEARNFATKFKLKFDEDELALIKFESALLTTKAIYIASGLAFFKKVKKFHWSDVRPRVKFHYTGELRCYVSDADYFAIDMSGYEKATGKKSSTDDNENANTFRDEITSLGLAIARLKERFSRH